MTIPRPDFAQCPQRKFIESAYNVQPTSRAAKRMLINLCEAWRTGSEHMSGGNRNRVVAKHREHEVRKIFDD